MRAVLCRELGGPEKLVVEEVPSPPMRDGAVRVAIHAAGLNFADILLIAVGTRVVIDAMSDLSRI